MNKFQFNNFLRAGGEFTNEQINGFYTRFCNGQITLEEIMAKAPNKDPVGVKGNYVDYRTVLQKDEPKEIVEQVETSEVEVAVFKQIVRRTRKKRERNTSILIDLISLKERSSRDLRIILNLSRTSLHALTAPLKSAGKISTRRVGSSVYYTLNEVAA